MERAATRRILVAPLDWGLGHTTRCIPIVRELLRQNCEVFLAGDETQRALLGREFPDLSFLHLPGYGIRYSRKSSLRLALMRQFPRLIRSIRQENEWLSQQHHLHRFDAVISDNRYGLYHPDLHSIILTHQLSIPSGWGKWADDVMRQFHYQALRRFTQVWVPDLPGIPNLAGALSHPDVPLPGTRYIGILSRLLPEPEKQIEYNWVISLSGPEPSRTQLEDRLIQELTSTDEKVLLIRGLPAEQKILPSTGKIRIVNHLPSDEMAKALQQAHYVIARSGYSTVMDLVTLNQKAVLIPTPGQTEQEYLSLHLELMGLFPSIRQQDFSIRQAWEVASHFEYRFPDFSQSSGLLNDAIRDLVQSLHSRNFAGTKK